MITFWASRVSKAALTPTTKSIMMMGAPGTGKSLLAKGLGPAYAHLCVDELLPDLNASNVFNANPSNRDKIILLEGGPKNEEQWNSLLMNYGRPLAIIELEASVDTVFERLQKEGDTAESIKRRIDEYDRITRPIALRIKEKVPSIVTINTDNLTWQQVLEHASSSIEQLESIPMNLLKP